MEGGRETLLRSFARVWYRSHKLLRSFGIKKNRGARLRRGGFPYIIS